MYSVKHNVTSFSENTYLHIDILKSFRKITTFLKGQNVMDLLANKSQILKVINTDFFQQS